ncbi:TauD/TfdA family dioxygenase [Rhodococcus sp. BP-316]|uniref:TauD/TfdA dioxygenase family protein n=1 Tax=Rhodococcus sp. BP-316 TaxID=2739445 RepID=UPI001C9B484B|nr:TauD/TfdA family dioxygenase [Rhodococcus sp. BP-316]MBY6680577.1 TauD/TfdA family dioxygenase [Rhodococcus sp. BP-316]
MKTVKLGANIGARIDDVRIGGDLPDEIVHEINEALLEHEVVFFRGQHHVDEMVQYAFAERLGIPTTPHPTVRSRGTRTLAIDSTYDKADSWHTDVTFVDRVPKASILRAVHLPPYGGTTTWASATAGYEQLPPAMKALAESLWAVHTNIYDYAATAAEKSVTSTAERYRAEFRSEYFEVEHPVVRVHPETGKRAILLGHFAKSFPGLSSKEFRALFELLQDQVTRLENTIRWSWELGDIAIWDNRSTQHYAVSDYDDQYRRLERITLAGDVPVSVQGEYSRVVAGDASGYSAIAS